MADRHESFLLFEGRRQKSKILISLFLVNTLIFSGLIFGVIFTQDVGHCEKRINCTEYLL